MRKWWAKIWKLSDWKHPFVHTNLCRNFFVSNQVASKKPNYCNKLTTVNMMKYRLSIQLFKIYNVYSSMTLLFDYLAPLQNDTIVMSQCMQFILGDKGEATCLIREYLWLKERGRERGNRALTLGQNMDTQTLLRFAHIHTEGAAYCLY